MIGAPVGRVCVLVLGDVGRSPRMQYHAHSVAEQYQCRVELVGHTGTPCFPIIQHHPFIRQVLFTPYSYVPVPMQSGWLLYAALACKALIQLVQLMYILLFTIHSPDIILLQTPPAIPTLLVVYIVSALLNCSVIVDWHNLAYTLLQSKYQNTGTDTNRQSLIVRVSARYEQYFGYLLNGCRALCVTDAMRRYLKQWAAINAVTLHDCPPQHFHALSIDEQHELWQRLQDDRTILPCGELYDWCGLSPSADTTLLTTRHANGTIHQRADRPVILISSTSWTADEDFSILLDALVQYDAAAQQPHSALPRLLCIITGKGPLRQPFLQAAQQHTLHRVRIVTMFVAASDYPLLLGSADLGVSLHQSSSGIDLPMKVVDMYGCSLPVCSRRFACIDELVQDGRTGLLFDDAAELSGQLQRLLQHFPNQAPLLNSMRQTISQQYSADRRWSANWNALVPALIQEAMEYRQLYSRRRQQYILAILATIPVITAMYMYTE